MNRLSSVAEDAKTLDHRFIKTSFGDYRCAKCERDFLTKRALYSHYGLMHAGAERRAEVRPNGRLVVGEFTIRPYGDGDYWISREDGEGMQVTGETFGKLIGDFYRANF